MALQCVPGHDSMCTHDCAEMSQEGEGMKFALFNQLQMPRPWRQHEEVLMYKEAITEAVHAEAVGFDAYWQTEHHFYTEIGHSSAPEIVLAANYKRTSRLS